MPATLNMWARVDMKKILFFILLFPSICNAGELYLNHSQTSGEVRGYITTVGIDDKLDVVDFSAFYKYGKTEGLISRDEGSFSFGYDPQIADSWFLWFDEVVGFNKVIGVKFENFAGGGLKYQALDSLSFSGGVLYHYQEGAESGEGLYSFRIKFEDETTKIICFYQPYFDDTSQAITKGRVEIKPLESIVFYYEFENRSYEDSSVSESGVRFVLKFGGDDD